MSANRKFSDYLGAKELLGYMMEEKDEIQVIDLSGGQPDIVPEYCMWFLEARREMGLDRSYYVWADDNLSNDYLWRYLTDKQIEHMVSAKGFSRVGCLKGFDEKSFFFNTKADGELLWKQIEILGRLVKTGFDQYGYITLTALDISDVRDSIALLLDKIQEEIHPNFPLRIVPLRIFEFNANRDRYFKEAERNQFYALDAWKLELENRFSFSQLSVPVNKVEIGG